MATTAPPGVVRSNLREFGELSAFSAGALKALPATVRYAAEVLRQTAIIIRGSTLFIALMCLAMAFSLTNFGYYFLKAAGAADYVGLVSGAIGPRTSIAMVFGYAFAAKVGCGLVSEIGAMKINEELDAYESEGVSVLRYVVGTRLLAALLFTPIAWAVCAVGLTAGCYINAVLIVNAVPSETFFRYYWANQDAFNHIMAYACIVLVTVALVLVACFYGLRASGGPAGVGRAVARSLLVNLVLIHIILGLAVFAIYGKDLGLPIGG
jgi:phospholipid/cholesterol/gamma-HCH transport system permease protein